MELWKRIRAARDPEAIHKELADEYQFHLEMATAEMMERGLSETEARIAAEKKFGPPRRLREESYDARGGGWIEEVSQDFTYGIRVLGKTPGKTALLILTLALGIGANTGVFSVIKSILLEKLPYGHAERLVVLRQANQDQAGGVSYPHFQDWKAGSRSFDDMAVYSYESSILTLPGGTTRIYGATVSSNLFAVLGVSPLRGRLFHPEEDRWPGADVSRPVLISDRLWRGRLGGNEDILGKRVVLDGKEFRVAGVIPAGLAFPVQSEQPDYWITLAGDSDPALYGGSIPVSRGYPRYDGAIARLKPGVTPEQASAEMRVLAGNIAASHPKATSLTEVRVTSLLESLVGPVRPMLLLIYGGVTCLLLIACANAATLLLVSAAGREQEFAVRAALGAKPGRLMRQLLIESLLVALGGGIAGAALAWGVVFLFARIAPADTPRLDNMHPDPWVLAYATAVSLATGLLFGLFPAVASTRADVLTRLKETARAVGGRSGGSAFWRNVLIAGQIALSMGLVCCATILGSSFLHILHAPRGFQPEGILTASVSLPPGAYPQRSRKVTDFYSAVLTYLRTTPGVVAASAAQSLPLSGQNNGTTVGVFGHSDQGRSATDLRFVAPNYFDTLRIRLQAGRLLNAQDTKDSPAVVVVNQTFVRRYLGGRNPMGESVLLGWGGESAKQIVGVVGDIRHGALATDAAPEVYVPAAQFPINDMAIVMRITGPPGPAADALRRAVAAVDPQIPVEQVRMLESYLPLSAAPQRFLLWVLTAFAGCAVLLSGIGLYGVLSYSTRCRRFEFGIRMALGSTSRGLVVLVVKQGLALAVTGVAGGLALAVLVSGALSRWLYETSATDPVSLVTSGIVLVTVALAACAFPAWRATCTSPLISLRAD